MKVFFAKKFLYLWIISKTPHNISKTHPKTKQDCGSNNDICRVSSADSFVLSKTQAKFTVESKVKVLESLIRNTHTLDCLN